MAELETKLIPIEHLYKSLDELVSWKANYNEGDVGMIMTSIVNYGYNRTISVWRNNVVMAGNHTMLALKMARDSGFMPRAYAPIDWFENEDRDKLLANYKERVFDDSHGVHIISGRWFIHVSDCSHLDRTTAIAYAVADNEAVKRAVQDESLLLTHLKEVQAMSIESGNAGLLLGTGYDDDEIAILEKLVQDDEEKSLSEIGDEYGESGQAGDSLTNSMTTDPIIRVQVSRDTFVRFNDLMDGAQETQHGDRLAEILTVIDDSILSWNK